MHQMLFELFSYKIMSPPKAAAKIVKIPSHICISPPIRPEAEDFFPELLELELGFAEILALGPPRAVEIGVSGVTIVVVVTLTYSEAG